MALGFVRPARSAEAGEIARLQLATWRSAYRRMLPRRILDEVDEGFLATRWAEAIEAPPSHRHRVLVAIEQADTVPTSTVPTSTVPTSTVPTSTVPTDTVPTSTVPTDTAGGTAERSTDHIVGFLASGPADEHALAPGEPPLGDTVAAITDLLVEPRWGRRGHGSRLLAAGVAHWRADGFGAAVAWAYDRDAATRSFLRSAGWEPDGATRALDVDDLLVAQVRLHTTL